MFTNKTFLITGIADENSLAMKVAEKIIQNNGKVVCTGLGVTPFHKNLSEKAASFLNKSYGDFETACKNKLGADTLTFPLDVTLPESLDSLVEFLNQNNVKLDGFLHAIAMDKTIRNKSVKPMLEVTAEEFNDTMTVSAFSLISLSHVLLMSHPTSRLNRQKHSPRTTACSTASPAMDGCSAGPSSAKASCSSRRSSR